MTTPRELKALYAQGVNITRHLREERGLERNTDDIIEMAYDLQAGSYVAAMAQPAMALHKAEYAHAITGVLRGLCAPESVLEAGVGEATTLAGVLAGLGPGVAAYGFDLSWSRVAWARRWLAGKGVAGTVLCTGNLFAIPFADDSVDVVYTSHSIEPNGGNEAPILKELFRVARRYVVLLEPCYELAPPAARARMEAHGYCRNLRGTAEALGYRVLRHELFLPTASPLNPTALTVIEKGSTAPVPAQVLACPRFRTPLLEVPGALYSPEALVAYPVLDGIPCLRVENGILASHLQELLGGG